MAIENKDVFTFGIIILCIGIALMFFPAYEYAPRVVFILRYFGVILAINAGILILLGGVWDSDTIFKVGFGLGMGAVGLVIGANIGNIVDIVMTGARLPFNTLLWIVVFEGDAFFQIMFLISTIGTGQDLGAAMVRAIVTFVLIGVILVLDILAFTKAKQGI
jgi:hypothetical protein